jgi:formate dehydrogenase major subunit
LARLEQDLADYSARPYLEQLQTTAGLGPLGRRLAERAPVWHKMGATAEPAARATMPKVAKASRLSGLDVEVEKGLSLAAAQEEAKRCLQCVCPSLGDCDLQRLGVEYGVTANELVAKDSRVRVVQPQYEHPFIRRTMERCISCGRCVRVCRDVAGPACYDFTGRGFTMNVDTPYSEALQLADCISCGRCVSTCPTGALMFNERKLTSFKVDEGRCIMCRECVNVCPVEALEETNTFETARQNWLQLVA